MRAAHARNVIVAAVAAAASVSTAACSSCPQTDTVAQETKEVDTARVCAALARGATEGFAKDCEEICGAAYNQCRFDGAYTQSFYNARAAVTDGGERSSCPVSPDGKPTVQVFCTLTETSSELTLGGCVVEGRRPERLVEPTSIAADTSSLGRYFANVAHLEAAAVLAFEHMITELAAHGAPAELVEAARSARADEVRHARATTRLAKRFGAVPPEARMEATAIRDLFDIALENEVEGIVRETLGAAIATWRAVHAADADIRATMSFIAADERRHAELSWQVGTWARSRLDASERVHLDAQRRAAVDTLAASFAGDPAADVVQLAGAPREADVHRLIQRLDQGLWGAPTATAA